MRDPVIRDALGLIVEMMSQPALLPIFARPKRLLRLARATRDAPSGNWLILLAVLLTVFGQQLPPRALQQLKSHKRHTVLSLVEEYGMFPGCVVREFFEKWLTIARARVSWAQSLSASDTPDTELQKQRPPAYWENEYRRGRLDIYKGTTFRQHEAVFGVKLAVTGTNLETYKCHLFSGSTTPCIPVADAIRISMSLPIAFKPIRIDSSDRRYTGGSSALEGLWIDGGLVNNIPLHAFDHEPGANPKTLGLRLGLDRRARIRTLQDYLKQWPLGILVGTGEAHISRTRGNSEQTINLDSMDLGLFEFSPSAARVRPIQEQARRDTLRYFGLGP